MDYRCYNPNYRSLSFHTFFIHRSRFRRTRKIIPRKHNSTHMAIHTPFSPNVGASNAANDRRTAQMLKKFIRHGTSVSAAPTKTP